MKLRNVLRVSLCCAGFLAFLSFSGCTTDPSKVGGGDSTVPSLGSVWYQVGVSNENFIGVSDSANGFVADSGVHNFALSFGVSGLPHCISDMMMMTNPPVGPTNMTQFLTYLATKNVSTIQNFLDSKVLTRIADILARLQALEIENAVIVFDAVKLYNLMTGCSNSGTNYVKFDAVEFYAADTMLSALAGLICLLDAHNLDVNMANLLNMATNFSAMTNTASFNTLFYNPFSTSTFGTLRSVFSYSMAKTYLQRAATKSQDFLDAYDLYRTVHSSSNVIPDNMPGEIRSVISYLGNWMDTTLSGTSVAFNMQFIFTNVFTNVDMGGITNTTTNILTNSFNTRGIKLNLGRFLDNTPSLRDLLVNFDSAGDPVFYTTNSSPVPTTPVNGGAYNLRFADTNLSFKGLFDGNLYAELTNSDLTNTDFTNVMPVLNNILLPGGYLQIAVVTNGITIPVPYTNAGYTSKLMNLYYSFMMYAH